MLITCLYLSRPVPMTCRFPGQLLTTSVSIAGDRAGLEILDRMLSVVPHQ